MEAPGPTNDCVAAKAAVKRQPTGTKRPVDLLSIGFSTAFVNDAKGVSVLQHPDDIWTERRDGAHRALNFFSEHWYVMYIT
jgi:hypothetical protein